MRLSFDSCISRARNNPREIEVQDLLSNLQSYIIAGGKSKRFGSDKRRIIVDGVSVIQRTYELLQSVVHADPVVVGDNLSGIVAEDWKTIPDHVRDKGPLGGLVSAIIDCRVRWLLILAVDLPFLSEKDLNNLLNNIDDEYDVITLGKEGVIEPLVALYHAKTRNYWLDRLENDRLSLSEGIRMLKWKVVEIDGNSRSLTNINTPDDFTK